MENYVEEDGEDEEDGPDEPRQGIFPQNQLEEDYNESTTTDKRSVQEIEGSLTGSNGAGKRRSIKE